MSNPDPPDRTTTHVRPTTSRRGLALQVILDGRLETHSLPISGRVVIGRGSSADVRIDHPSISRQHVALELGPPLLVEDLGSANGSRLGGRRLKKNEPIEATLGEVLEIGAAAAVIQAASVAARPQRIWSHGYFEGRLEEECVRAESSRSSFSVVHLHVAGSAPAAALEETLVGNVRTFDPLARYGPGDYEVLLLGAPRALAEDVVAKLADVLRGAGWTVRSSIATFPEDGRSPEQLIAKIFVPERTGGKPGAAMAALDGLIERVAPSNINVLILGETGVGKEVLAETIYLRSHRAGKPFLRLNCASLSESLLESELFGHEKGAFTGATQAKPGLLETAEGGTVFFDEIGELPAQVQVKLLRVLEERQVRRVGALKSKALDVRILSATNRDLDREIEGGRFRSDLFYRLNGMTFVIPPLRERRAEIIPLARQFIRAACRDSGRKELTLSARVRELLESYSWPGNVRELRNMMERAVLLCTGEVLEPEHLPIEKMSASTVAGAGPGAAPGSAASGDAGEREQILDALARCAGNQKRAAELLGISRPTLLARLDQYGIPRPRKGNR